MALLERSPCPPIERGEEADASLEVLHARIAQYLEESSSTLEQTRKNLTSLFHNLPQEVLLEIFLNIVFDRINPEGSQPPSMQEDVWLIYHRLYRLVGVCSTWRDILVARGVFWSVVPMVSSPSAGTQGPFQLSLQRAGGSMLHLAAESDSTISSNDIASVLLEHGPRFHSINIRMGSEEEINSVINSLLENKNHGSLSELSIQLITSPNKKDGFAWDSQYIIRRDSPQRPTFSSLIKSLTVFRIYGARFYWDTIAFSSRLTELQIEQVSLGSDEEIVPFVQALSSATSLRDLKIISIVTFSKIRTTPNLPPPITFPKLQSLFIKDLYFNTLQQLLPMIAPGFHRQMIFLSPNSLKFHSGVYKSKVDFGDLCRFLQHGSVDTLLTSGPGSRKWLSRSNLSTLLETMATLETLKLHSWEFERDPAKHPAAINQTENHPPLPGPRNIYLTSAVIYDIESFLDLMTSHSFQHVVLGGNSMTVKPDKVDGRTKIHWEPLREESGAVRWLRENAPDLDIRLVGEYCPPEFCRQEWRLW